MKTPTVNPIYGQRLTPEQRHYYTPLTEEQKTERDPNDPVRISFVVTDPEMEAWFDERLKILKDYDANFYVQINSTLNGVLYQISTRYRNMQSEEYKKFIFQVKLKLGEDVKIR